MKKIITLLLAVVAATILAYSKLFCPVDDCQLYHTGVIEFDERGHMYKIYKCYCCNRTFSVRD